ncbi:hypothetical protein OUZ56_028074 [Daphnia magna]|uniref:Uncharacterized protein n=1 Tax=Daphnia magna TaxID=35525 RepID=A0ABR0B2T0_9CRUS|nr:hypothetical protein OUZ56_028074 [Daphnia magna]
MNSTLSLDPTVPNLMKFPNGLDKPELVIAPELTRAIFLCFPVHFLICVRPISRPLGSHELVLEQKGSCIRK